MNCNCRAEIEAKLTERLINQFPDAKNHRAVLNGYGFGIIGNKMVEQGCVQINSSADHQIKKSGEYKQKKTTGSMIWSFCPFCGKPAKDKS